jgi:hypothetical protein
VWRRACAVLVAVAALSAAAGCSSSGGGRPQASGSESATPAASAGQLTGVQLKAKLLPASDFPVGYHVEGGEDSGAGVARSRTGVNLATEGCAAFVSHSLVALLGATAYAGETLGNSAKSAQYLQFIWQFATAGGAAAFYRYVLSLPARCPKTSLTNQGLTEEVTIRGQPLAPAEGHSAIEVVETGTVAGSGAVFTTVWSVDGTELLAVGLGVEQGAAAASSPSLSTLISDLIANVRVSG